MSRHWVERLVWVGILMYVYGVSEQNSVQLWDRHGKLAEEFLVLQTKYDRIYKGSAQEAEDIRHANWKALPPRTD